MPHKTSPPSSLSTLHVDAVVEGTPYRVVRRINEGGMGVVYEVEHMHIRERRALKILRRALADRPDYEERLLREAKALERLKDARHVVRYYESGRLPSGRPYYVMALVEGETLRSRLERGPLALGEALGLGNQMLSALKSVHAAGIVHRDVKPENIVIRPNGEAVLIDLGLAKETSAGALGPKTFSTAPHHVVGTGPYLPPELLYEASTDARGDLYAAGIVLYECLAGSLPRAAGSDVDYYAQIAVHGLPPLSEAGVTAPPALESVVARATSTNPDARYQTAEAFAIALTEAVAPSLLTTRPAPALRLIRAKARLKAFLALVCPAVRAIVVGLVSGVALMCAVLALRRDPMARADAPDAVLTDPAPTASAAPGGARRDHLEAKLRDRTATAGDARELAELCRAAGDEACLRRALAAAEALGGGR